MLAQASADVGVFGKLTSGEFPTKADYVRDLAGLHEVWAVLLITLGVVYLLTGWQTFKALVVANAVALGAVAGSFVGGLTDGKNLALPGGIAGALLFGVLSLAVTKGAIGVMGALAGAFAGYGLWSYAANLAGQSTLAQHAWAGGLLGLVTLGLLGLVVYNAITMIFSSLQGAVMGISGLLALLLKPYGMPERLQGPLAENIHVLPLLFGVIALLGFSLQYIAATKKARKKRKAASA